MMWRSSAITRHKVISVQERLVDRAIPAPVARELAELRAENARLRRLLKLTRAEAAPPGPAQAVNSWIMACSDAGGAGGQTCR